ncbi:PilW family protein [Paraburkholderia sp. DHOC27]|uniref:PilW family protein n=1 Tax=Paraburkholderia sp. DHOC27 TaxID=2303330 RepID=UPI000E3D30AF|nr:PilW family protein [Paraburkholderia sp. DHOC27]RFU45910.1 type IV pillus assembly protein [Paraburkholderia sp. DHOC27]
MKHRSSPLRGAGHTLIELMIALALGLVVTTGAISLYRSQRAAFGRADDAIRIRDAGLTALTVIGQQVQMAGFIPADAPQAQQRPTVFGCSAARPTGADDNPVCEALTGRSDGIAIRYVGDSVSTWPSATGQTTDCLGQAVSTANGLVGGNGVLVVNRFYAKASSSTGEPELYCDGNGKSGSAQPLVEGIERLRVKYWLTGAQSGVDASALASAQWANVVAVDLCVLVRGAPQGRNSRYVDCDGVSALTTDSRAREAFWRRVAIRNNEGAAT